LWIILIDRGISVIFPHYLRTYPSPAQENSGLDKTNVKVSRLNLEWAEVREYAAETTRLGA